jgi:AAA domain
MRIGRCDWPAPGGPLRCRPSPGDWVYVNNFSDPDRPTALDLPAGRAPKFRDAMHELIDNLKTALPAVFQSEDDQTRRAVIDETFHKKQGDAFSALVDCRQKSPAIEVEWKTYPHWEPFRV